jgi:hypothetical protein
MQIKIKEKFKIISHDLGESFLILNTSYFVRIYPGLLLFKDLNSNEIFKFFLKFQGPVKNFTILQNLYNGNIEVNFLLKNGYVSYKILVKEDSVYLYFDKITLDYFEIEFNKAQTIRSKEEIKLPISVICQTRPEEYLFMGIHKKPDIYLIKKRENLEEILPFIFLYSQFFLNVQYSCCLRKNCLLKEIDKNIQSCEKKQLCENLINVFKVHFFGSFIPRINDEEYQNITEFFDKDFKPWCIFKKLYQSIKSMLIKEKKDELFLLPCLIQEFNQGRAINIKTSFGTFDLEWSKKIIKKAIFKPLHDINLKLALQSQIKTFRLRVNKNEKGKIFKNNDEIAFKKENIYLLDKFQK